MNGRGGRTAAADLELVVQDAVVVAWRSWRFQWRSEIDGFCLTSVCHSIPFPPQRALAADCVGPRSLLGHAAPEPSCRCGIHAVAAEDFRILDEYSPWPSVPPKEQVRSGERVRQWRWLTRDRVVGTVSLWGEVIECEHGFRAQYAYPRELLVPEEFRCGGWHSEHIVSVGAVDAAYLIGQLYGVPATVVPDGELRSLLGL